MKAFTRFKRHGITIIRPADRPHGNFSCRIKFRGKLYSITLRDTVEDSFKAALLAKREIHAQRWADFQTKTGLRAECITTLADVIPHYRAFPGDTEPPPSAHTKEKNIQAIARLLAVASPSPQRGEGWGEVALTSLTREFIVNWRSEIWKLANAAGTPDSERSIQIRRSANSTLLQARSLFTDAVLPYYRDVAKLTLPSCLAEWRLEPGFKSVAKTEYHAPPDNIIARTLNSLTEVGRVTPCAPDDNMKTACWLAIGFGMRAGEIARATIGDFVKVNGDVFFRPSWRAKNNRVPEIGVQLDAWPRLEPLLGGTSSTSPQYALVGTATERTSEVFRRISDWMRTLGWATTHHIHELRAWAGCQIANNHPNGIRAAQAFMRHSTFATTEKFYGHYLKVRMDKVQLTIPALDKPFEPKILEASA